MKTDIEIAQSVQGLAIEEIARKIDNQVLHWNCMVKPKQRLI